MTKRKWIIGGAAALVLLLAAMLIVPLLFRDRAEAAARAGLNRALDARVDWSGTSLTFFRDFPNLTLGLDDFTVVGVEAFEGDTLAAIGSFRVVVDVGSVVRSLFGDGSIVVRSIRLDRPVVSLEVLEDGTANWNIVKRQPAEAQPEEPGRDLNVELRSVELTDGSLVFRNEQSGLLAALEGLHHTLSGNFSRDSLGIRTSTRAERTTLRFAGTPWLSGVALDFDADIDADLADGRFAFRDNVLRLNDLELRFEGSVARADSAFDIDVRFAAPETDFRRILSLVPVIYGNDFAALETEGTFSLEGYARGRYAPGTLPGFGLEVDIGNGMFRYPDLPLPARAIALDMTVENPGGSADATVVDLRRFHAEIGGEPIEGALTLRTPVSDPAIDASLRGTLDLADLARTIRLDSVQEMAGVVSANAHVRARRSDIDARRYDRVDASGTVAVRGVTLSGEAFRQPLAIEEAVLRLTPQRADLESFQAMIGSSDIRASGALENLLGFVMWDQPLRGNASFDSRRFVLDEWRSEDPDREVIPVPPMLDLTLNGTIGELVYGALTMTDARGTVRVHDQRVTLDGFTVETLGGRIGVTGYYETVDPSRPVFAIDLVIDSLDIRSAAESLLTVRTLAPVAQYAQGTFSAELDLSGALGSDMTPLFDALQGAGSLLTSRIALEGFPLMQRLADALEVPQIGNPTLNAIRSSFDIREGRLHLRPVQVGVGDFRMLVSGSNGIDQSLDYTIQLAVPRSVLGSEANRVVQSLADRAGRAGIDLAAADSIQIGARVTGTITDPSIDLGLGEVVASMREQVQQAAAQTIEERVDEARERIDSARAEAVRQAQARADSIVARAQEQADSIRAEAARLAERVRAEGNQRADEVLSRANNDIARLAAQPVADRIRREADTQAANIEREAGERADALVAEARRRADELVQRASGGT